MLHVAIERAVCSIADRKIREIYGILERRAKNVQDKCMMMRMHIL